jgi:D-alanyl-D-alanine carboxypeptidase/D-alanyl-D-alanine-endopeptidase (penicillin-binding protein 4)
MNLKLRVTGIVIANCLRRRAHPATHNLKPVTHNLKPVTHNLKPVTHNLKPVTHNLKPVTFLSAIFFFSSCSIQKQIDRSAKADVLTNKALQAAHVGLSIFDPSANKYLYNYQGDKYFVPASNTKIPTCYAAMKYLGDSLVGLRYGTPEESFAKEHYVVVKPTGDPSFLHDNFNRHPVFSFLLTDWIKKRKIGLLLDSIEIERWGSGWSWNDYDASYMVERNRFPVFGNVIKLQLNTPENRIYKKDRWLEVGQVVKTRSKYFDSLVNLHSNWISLENAKSTQPKFTITRELATNQFRFEASATPFVSKEIPFVTDRIITALKVLEDTLKKPILLAFQDGGNKYQIDIEAGDVFTVTINNWNKIYSQPTDSLLKPMMHRSDNFFAEQSLLMVSNEKLGIMNDAKIIDTILKTDFKDLPQKPRWADGSGLSRYNLFTPQDFVAILNKMKTEFGMERIKTIFPTGGEGTISSYYKADSGYIYGKTGTLSGVVAFSGFMYTQKGKLLIFSTLVNNHQASATDVRRAIEKFLQQIRNRY